MKKLNRKTILFIVLMSLPIICVGIIFWILAEFRTAAREIEENWVKTDIAQYSEIRGQWYNEALFGHFPSEVPTNATEVQMLYSPPFLQKGLLFQLWLKLPADEIKKLQMKYREISSQKEVEVYLPRSYPALNRFRTSDSLEGEILPVGYEIIVLGAEDFDNGNHGHTYGVAINSSTSEILYWAEAW